MNISSLSSAHTPVPPRVTEKKPGAPETAGASSTGESFSAAAREKWSAALAGEPVVRPEVLERARQLAQDPNYPSANTVEEVARRLLRS